MRLAHEQHVPSQLQVRFPDTSVVLLVAATTRSAFVDSRGGVRRRAIAPGAPRALVLCDDVFTLRWNRWRQRGRFDMVVLLAGELQAARVDLKGAWPSTTGRQRAM